jgi:hypothetical protein
MHAFSGGQLKVVGATKTPFAVGDRSFASALI